MQKRSVLVVTSRISAIGVAAGLLVALGACGDDDTSSASGPDASVVIDSGTSGSMVDAATGTDAMLADSAPPPPADSGSEAGTPTGCETASTDTYWSQVLAYIPCTSTITDVSGKSTIAMFNDPTVSATPAGAPGGSSCSLGNKGGQNTARGFQITMPASVGAGDYTIEVSVFQTAWYEPTDQQSEILIGNTAYPPSLSGFPAFFSHSGTNKIQFIASVSSGYTDTTSELNTWQSYAASRINGTTYLFRNGTFLTSFADARDYTDKIVNVGHQANGSYNAVMGSVGQIRITNAGRYTTSYSACAAGYATK